MRVAGLAPGRGATTRAFNAKRTVWLGDADRRRVRRASRAWAKSRDRSASCCRRSRRATASRRSSSRSSAGCIRSASCFASLLMSLLYLGGEAAQMKLALPSAVTGLFQGTLLFFLLAVRRVHPLSRCASIAARRSAPACARPCRLRRDENAMDHARPILAARHRRRHAARVRGAGRARHREVGRAEPRRRRHDAGRRGRRVRDRRGHRQVAVARRRSPAWRAGARCR